jgi:malto-oligosyltrehalose trehalohydrolase
MKRRHRMPFGAEVHADGRVRFSLWAPAASRVEVSLQRREGPLSLPLLPQGGGWHQLETGQAAAADRYRYEIDGRAVPDPASRFNPDDVHGASEVVDAAAYDWADASWHGRPWHEAVVYELHVGTFTPEGTFGGVAARLGDLQRLGVTAIELMPVADFDGRWNWGYDGVLLYAPASRYGRPEALKALVDAAHARGIMVLLDVVYNHFGPVGNYLAVSAPQFFSARQPTPWGPAIDFDGPASRTVRDFFVHNALYWLEEFHFDGLRLDAIHAIRDASVPDLVSELTATVRDGPGRGRYVHLVLENMRNEAHRLVAPGAGHAGLAVAQWNDDFHHALHAHLTGERAGYYADYADDPLAHLGRCLAEGFAYQGARSAYRGGTMRGEPSATLPPTVFVNYLQTHDQVGNRPFGERLSALVPEAALRAAVALCLLAPAPPMLFMGEEYAAAQPFRFFCDFADAQVARNVRAGRNRYHARFRGFEDAALDACYPDPTAQASLLASRLDWDAMALPQHARMYSHYAALLDLRRRWVVPLLPKIGGGAGSWRRIGAHALALSWATSDGRCLRQLANLGPAPCPADALPAAAIVYAPEGFAPADPDGGATLAPWSVVVAIDR